MVLWKLNVHNEPQVNSKQTLKNLYKILCEVIFFPCWQVTGSFQSVQDALLHITSRIRETVFPMKTFPSAGMTQYVPAASEIPPFPRPIHESTPPGCYSTVGLFHGADPSIGLSNIPDRPPPLSHGVDRLVVDRIPMSYGPDTTGPRPAIDHPSPRSWAPEVSLFDFSGVKNRVVHGI